MITPERAASVTAIIDMLVAMSAADRDFILGYLAARNPEVVTEGMIALARMEMSRLWGGAR